MSLIYFRNQGETSHQEVSDDHPLPVTSVSSFQAFDGSVYSSDIIWKLAADGRLFVASDADQNDMVTGQTSFANTTPTFLLRVPAGTIAVPIFLNLSQSGTVAGDFISVVIEADDVDRWASGGTAETVFTPRKAPNIIAQRCSLLSGATASSGYGVRIWGATIAQDVSPAEGAVQGPFWKPEMPYFLEGPASLLIYTYAGSTGPTWLWSIGWAEFDSVLAA